MKSRTKVFAALAAIGVLGAGTLAVAQPGGGCDGRMGMAGGMRQANFDPAARADQQLARLKTDLKVTPAQEPLWQAFAENVKAEAGKGFQTMRNTSQDLSLSAPERMAQMTELMKQRVAAMETVNASFSRLYESLTPPQKRVADIHAANMGRGGHHGHFGRGGPRGPGGPQGPASTTPPANMPSKG